MCVYVSVFMCVRARARTHADVSACRVEYLRGCAQHLACVLVRINANTDNLVQCVRVKFSLYRELISTVCSSSSVVY